MTLKALENLISFLPPPSQSHHFEKQKWWEAFSSSPREASFIGKFRFQNLG